jgi:tRNA pseudouridine38-40 synthase
MIPGEGVKGARQLHPGPLMSTVEEMNGSGNSERSTGKRRRNIRLLLEYDGLPFHGWQIQPQSPTIQEVLQRALERITGEEAVLKASGRTDAGVHALGQVANFHTRSGIATDAFPRALNSLTPPSITVLEAGEVDPSFDSQFSALSKTYRYFLLLRPHASALDHTRHWHVPSRLNLPRMRRAASLLTGKRDFSSFRAAGCGAKSPVRRLSRLEMARRGDRLSIELEADGFLRHMVRNIVGTLVEIGRGRLHPDDIPLIVKAKDRSRAGVTAPPYGLFLHSVVYPAPSSRSPRE